LPTAVEPIVLCDCGWLMVQEQNGVTCANPKCPDRGRLYIVSTKLTEVKLAKQ
jgi:hypothetical protein